MRLARRDVRDHIKYSKTGCWRSYRFYRASQRLKSPTCIICEILGARDFRVFQHNPPKASSIAGSSVKGHAKIDFAILGLLVRSPHLERYARLTLPAAKLTCLRRRAEQALSNRSSPRDRDASERLPCLAPRSAGARCIDQAQIRAPPGKNDLDRRQANEP